MMIREDYEENSERRDLPLPLAYYHVEDSAISLHWHRELEFWWVQGDGVLEVEGNPLAYQSGDLLFLNRQLLHRTPAPLKSAEILVFDLPILLSPLLRQDENCFLNRLDAGELLLPSRIGPKSPLYAPLLSRFIVCCRCAQERLPGWEWRLQGSLLEMLDLFREKEALIPAPGLPSGAQHKIIMDSILWMRRNFAQEVTLPMLAGRAALSPSHYLRLFRRYTGQTPFAFLQDIRLAQAAVLLRQGQSVTETALQVGIPNVSYFIRRFRARYGRTPKQYQLEHHPSPEQ